MLLHPPRRSVAASTGSKSTGPRKSAEMRYANPRLRRVAARLLAHEAGDEPASSESLAAASARLLDRLAYRVALVVGPVGVQAIFSRAVKLWKHEFAFLDERVSPPARDDIFIEPLRACLREQQPAVIQEVSEILFATFVGLLTTIIGDRLTWSLLEQIWPDALLLDTELPEAEE